MTSPVPDHFAAVVHSSAGRFVITVHRAWAPHGADRFHALVRAGYYDDSRFFRVVADRWAQFGIAGDPDVAQAWRGRTIPDDVVRTPNFRGFVAFANTGPNTRSTQVYINLRDNAAQLDHEPGFAPFGQVTEGMAVVDALHAGYGESAGGGLRAGRQDRMFAEGNAWLDAAFPELSRVIRIDVKEAVLF